jgi:carbonic anhydrase/acetyltransferase-like protein (isoleucine patch superfamily)
VRAYRVASGRTIAPFGDRVRDLCVGARQIASWQEDACKACGLELADVADLVEANERPALIFFDDHFFTEMALRQLMASVMSDKSDAALGVRDSAILRTTRVLDDERPPIDGAVPFDIFFVAGSEPARSIEELRARCKIRVQEADEQTIEVQLPHASQGEDRSTVVPFSARVVVHVRHWVHLLRASQLAIGATLLDRLRHNPRLAFRLKLMRGRDPWERARAVSFVDKTARIHPTADIECAVIGPGAVIEAHAHVHRSVLGKDVHIGDHAAVMGCALGDQVQVLRASYLAFCHSMPGSTLASYKVQLSLFGSGVFLTTSAWLIDAKLKGEVKVEHDGRLVSVGTPFLGACLGHRVTLGAQVAIQAGRVVPNDSVVVAPPGTFADVLPTYPPGTLLTVRDGRLVPVQRG